MHLYKCVQCTVTSAVFGTREHQGYTMSYTVVACSPQISPCSALTACTVLASLSLNNVCSSGVTSQRMQGAKLLILCTAPLSGGLQLAPIPSSSPFLFTPIEVDV